MQIQQNYPAYNYKTGISKRTDTCSNIGFKGHAQVESCSVKGIKKLIHQTSMGRELETKNFVCDYIKNRLGHKDKVNIVSAGCSTGEEPVTMSMLLYDMKDKVNILGIDLGKKAIKQANSRKYVFEIPQKHINLSDYFQEISSSPYTDVFLTKEKNSGLNAYQSRLLSLFNEFFEPTNRKIKTPLAERIYNILSRSMHIEPLTVDRAEYQLKKGMAENCTFKQGNVQDIDKILGNEKADVISCCNMLYHLTTVDPTASIRTPKPNSKEIIKELMTKFKNCLNDNGLIVFGEKESAQMGEDKAVATVMTELNFAPMNGTDEHFPNVWRKL